MQALRVGVVVALFGSAVWAGGRGRAGVEAAYGRLPLSFEQNVGQTDPAYRFLAHGPGYRLSLASTVTVISLAWAWRSALLTASRSTATAWSATVWS